MTKRSKGCLWVLGVVFAALFLLLLLVPTPEPTRQVVTTTRYEEPEPEPEPPARVRHALEEPDSIVPDSMDAAVIGDLALIVRSRGYRCDSVSAASHAVFTAGRFTLRCNQYRYEYLIEDRGGNWVVTVE